MLKRSTKVISLLVVAASIVSMVPAMAADVQKVTAQDGTVYSGKSNADGTFYIDAELNGADEAIYSYKDGKYTKVDGAEAGNTIGDVVSYEGNTYLEMADGDYYVNLKTGETTKDDIKGNIDDDAQSALRTKIKNDNDGRFAESTYTGNVLEADASRNDGTDIKPMYGATGVWRQYHYDLKTAVSLGGYAKSKSSVYSDDKGNYIDADYNLGRVGVVSTTYGAVTIENTEDTYEATVGGTTYEIKAQINNDKTWDEGPEYITRTADLSVFAKVKGAVDSTYVNITDAVGFGSKSNNHKQTAINNSGTDTASVTVMQKVSKAQASGDKDGIKYAKDVKTYFITDADGVAKHLLGLADAGNSDVDHSGYGLITGGTQGAIVSVYRSFATMKQYAETINFKGENGYYYTDIGDTDDVEVDSANGFTIGCGDLYALSKDGYVEEFIGKDSSYKKLYKVDGGMNKISISLPMFATVWNQDDSIYSMITPGASAGDKKDATASTDATTTTAAATATATTAGWVKATDGTWSFVKADGTKATAWLQDGSTWYYLNAAGVMQTGWINDNGTWYYCNGSGAMLANTTVDGYVLGASGAWVK